MAFTFKHGDRPLEGYTIQRGVGRGGFGEVYYAVSDGGKDVALKYLRDNPEIELRGVEQCMNLKSPHLVSIYDVRKNPSGEYFVIMEYVAGPSLRDLMIAEPLGLGVQKAAFILKGLCAGLTYLHDRGIVHRDLKPGNIFFDDGYVKIGDYGLTKFISVSRHSAQTSSVGTVHYMAPEVGSGNYSKTIDIYAVGVMLYEMLLGKVPFEGSSMGEVLMKHLTQQPEVDGLPQPFGRVIRKALEKNPSDRYQSCEEMATDVFGVADVQRGLEGFDAQRSLGGAAAHAGAAPYRLDVLDSPNRRPMSPTVPPPVPHPATAGAGDPRRPGSPGLAVKALAPEVSAGVISYAGFWVRVLATLIDGLILAVPCSIAGSIIPVIGGMALAVAYQTILIARWQGQTIGKRVCGIRVINADGTMCDSNDALRRALAKILNVLTLGIGYLMVAFDDRKRGLHDRVAGTLHIHALDEPVLGDIRRAA